MMKIKINKIGRILLIICLTVLASCSDDFLDVNDNPNNPPTSTPKLTLPVAQQQLANLYGTSMMYLGQYFAYSYAVPSNWSANGDLLRYNVTNTFYTNIFESSYADIFKNLTFVEEYADPQGVLDYSSYKVITETLSGFQYQYLVDLYGDVPYSEANQRGGNTTPVYDNEETIYKNVIDSLTTAANLALNIPSENSENPGDSDIILHGDMTAWAQFANTVKLRMLMRMSNSGQDSYIQEQIALIDANGAGYITDNISANPGYSQNADQQTPVYGYLGYQSTGVETDRHDFTVATDYAIDLLDSTNDPRILRIYTGSDNADELKGVNQSINLPGEGFTSDDLSAVGPGILKSADQDQPLMLLSEALFLQAEAVTRGYIPGGDAVAMNLYNQAIEASFDYLEAEDAQTYYSQAIENVSWASSSDKIEAIITQKWIALNGISIEPWIEYTRTGFPTDLPTSVDGGNRRPIRLLYPTSEYSRNSDNVPPTTTEDAFTKNPFWK
ncbi:MULTISPECIES: SusD/RagB family nutrient-binding outer membrane lipoprotein [Galbibacter]|uniref:SusD/RagB family nutrient-binding outer membrane lipoprotein n=1 Tax=Galbibacter pacificus TaxID=2996052 RepID=A0ABT6FM45_9FLAO|nr:SusD/RagB family nutrient-binding outer membrane lipoprotein [Galbibacter pacificus]MDG3580866.1 SusD/RagB family nutrient-binding outer membrane lipoprotein [Galbibacter pacificus]MDG3584344.1 SusD/RagB family nutrient-binding outer membrane lipoprotein [Galbibacter pacificus]